MAGRTSYAILISWMALFALAAQADDEVARLEARSTYSAILAKYTTRIRLEFEKDRLDIQPSREAKPVKKISDDDSSR